MKWWIFWRELSPKTFENQGNWQWNWPFAAEEIEQIFDFQRIRSWVCFVKQKILQRTAIPHPLKRNPRGGEVKKILFGFLFCVVFLRGLANAMNFHNWGFALFLANSLSPTGQKQIGLFLSQVVPPNSLFKVPTRFRPLGRSKLVDVCVFQVWVFEILHWRFWVLALLFSVRKEITPPLSPSPPRDGWWTAINKFLGFWMEQGYSPETPECVSRCSRGHFGKPEIIKRSEQVLDASWNSPADIFVAKG